MADGTATAASAPAPAPLDDVMLAMDVVDTLRHREALVLEELASGAREEQLLERLRQIYASQGIEVSDAVLQEGIEALKEGRFVYQPPAHVPTWARVYVTRGRWGKALLALVVVAAVAVGAYWALVVTPQRQFASDLEALHAETLAASQVVAADQRADTLYQQARTAHARGDTAEARASYAALEALRTQLEQSYTLRIAQAPVTGLFRVPDVNTGARNYYVVVEAYDANGRRLTVPVRNEETGEVEEVQTWGLRVDEVTYERVRADKLDDGIVQDDLFGEKQAGFLEPEYYFDTTGAAITEW